MNTPQRFCILSSLLTLVSFGSPAQETDVYKGLDDQGRVVYSNSSQGILSAQKIKLASPIVSGNAAVGAAPDNPGARAKANAPSSPAKSSQNSGPEHSALIQSSQNALNSALEAQTSGQEPQEGERIGTAGGGSRLTPAYFSRQNALAQAVADARAKLAKALEQP